MKRFVSHGVVATAAALLALGTAACSSTSTNTPAAGGSSSSSSAAGGSASVGIGFMGALSGENAQLGKNIEQGAQLAIDAYNATSPATKINFKMYDTAGDPTQAVNQAKQAVTDKVVGMVGPAFSGESATAVPILEEAGIPNISASATNVKLSTNGWKTWHRVLANDGVQGPDVAKFMVQTLGEKSIAVIDDQSEYGKGLADAVNDEAVKDGATVGDREAIDIKAADYSAVINKIKSKSVDGVFYGGYYSQASKFVKQLRDAGVQAKFVSGDGVLDQQFIDGAPNASEGALLSCTCVLATTSSDANIQKFITDYKAKWNADPATYSAEGFDVATAFIKAVQAGKTSASDINTFLGTEDFDGVSKHIKWQPNGELAGGSTYMHEVKGGKIIALGDYSTAKPE